MARSGELIDEIGRKAMKQAIIITAYENIEFLKELVKLYSQEFSCYVHIDKITKISD